MCFVISVSDKHCKAGFEINKLLQLKADVLNSLLLIPHFTFQDQDDYDS